MLMRAADLQNSSGSKIRFLSTGMRTRLAIAASLINDPDVLIWDEPAHALDPGTRRTMIELMRSLSENKTLLLCTHNLLDVQEVCDRSIVLHEGQLIFDGAATELAGSMKPSSVEITLKGDKKGVQESYKTMQAMDELESCVLQKNVLRLKIRSDASHAGALATALQVIADHKVEVVDLKPAGQQADQAIANLVLKETGRGLTRAYQTVNS